MERIEIRNSYSRDDFIGHPTFHKVSDLGLVQFKHTYDRSLLDKITKKAVELKEEHAFNRHLSLRYIRGAQRFIPEINDLIYDAARLGNLSKLAGTELESYPLDVITSLITFMGPSDEDGSVGWHTDGAPVIEQIPLVLDKLEGGELQVYQGDSEVGLYKLSEGEKFNENEFLCVAHHKEYSMLSQFFRVLHRTNLITKGQRITLVLNLRSKEKSFINDNTSFYVGADNPDFDWFDQFRTDVRERQLPAYQAYMKKSWTF